MNRNTKLLLALLIFNSLSAIGGGIALMAGAIKQPEWIVHTSFTSLYFPGVILMAIVGGSSLIASLALCKKVVGWQLACLLAGVIMVFWIIGEIVSIRGIHWLQAIYFITAVASMCLIPSDTTDAKQKV